MSTHSDLSTPFPPEALRELNKGGTKLTYVPVSEVIARLNRVLGVDGWSITESEAWRDEGDPDWVIAKVTILADIDGFKISRIGWGGQQIKRTKKGTPLDLGDEFKGATSDALKKAAQAFGVGLDLARDEEMLWLEEQSDKEKINRDTRLSLTEQIEKLKEDERKSLGAWWKGQRIGSLKDGDVNVDDVPRIEAKLQELAGV